jgi:hypothetical protein
MTHDGGKMVLLASNRRHVETTHRRGTQGCTLLAGRSAVSETTSSLLEFRQREVEI